MIKNEAKGLATFKIWLISFWFKFLLEPHDLQLKKVSKGREMAGGECQGLEEGRKGGRKGNKNWKMGEGEAIKLIVDLSHQK